MSSDQKLDCILCKEVFNTKDELQIHFRKHGDPNFKQNKQNSSKSEMSGEKLSDKVEMVACDVCPEVFPTISKAITHKHKVHPEHDAKYFCPWCGKLFTMKHLYNKHIQSNHTGNERSDDKTFPCDVCSVAFYLPSAMMYHNKFFHRQDTDMPDIGQSKKIRLYNQEVITIFYCAFCGEEYENKVNLSKHVTDEHSDENQSPDEVLRCPLCDAIFYHLDAYEVHLTFHTTEDVYSVQNDMFAELEEFSLESVPPVVEKVESLNTQDPGEAADAESTLNSIGIDKFLEIAMDNSQDGRVKAKKHKKHKKSKKAAITLDEFLNMNKDVFGEGLDFQGVEEVPTRVVTKRLKTIKKPANTNTATLKDLAKLKKQGLVIKKKSDVGPVPQTMKILKGPLTNPIKFSKDCTVNKISPDAVVSSPDDVLSRLMSQSNNSIKITKKSSNQDNSKPVESNTVAKSSDNGDAPVEKQLTNVDEPAAQSESSFEDTEEKKDDSNTDCESSHALVSNEPESPISKNDEDQMCNMDSENKSLAPEKSPTEVKVNPTESADTKQTSHDSLSNLQKKGIIIVKQPKSSDSDKNSSVDPIDNEKEHSEHNFTSDNEDNISGDNETTENFRDSEEHKVPSPVNEPLSALKGLSHLITVKPVSKAKTEDDNKSDKSPKPQSPVHVSSKTPIPLPPPVEKEIPTPQQKLYTDKDPTLDTLKNLSKTITIKPVPQKTNNKNEDSDHDFDDDHDLENDSDHDIKSAVINKNISLNNLQHDKNESNFTKPINSPNRNQPLSTPMTVSKATIINSTKNLNADILKRLPNITTKPVLNKKPERILKPIFPQKYTPQNNDGDIEIFNIDDSDDEEDNKTQAEAPKQISKPSGAINTLSKNITVKSVNQNPLQKIIKSETTFTQSEEEHFEEDNGPFTDESDDNIDTEQNKFIKTKFCSQKLSNNSVTMKNALKNLGKNVTVKSRNSSPSQSNHSFEHHSQDSNHDFDEAGNDSDSSPGNVKITEMNDATSDDEINPDNDIPNSSNAIVQSPDDSFSEHENDELEDFEKEITASTMHKSSQKVNTNTAILNTLKNIGKNITIKSLNDQTESEEKPSGSQVTPEVPDHLNKQLAIRPYKRPPNKDHNSENGSKTFKMAQTFSPNQVNQKMSSSATANQVNTVNKEVTVKTFQTKTVIQEITTTVTKTIKTVNQTMKQEVRNSSQNNAQTPQRIQGIRPNQGKNLQGMIVRQAQPVGPRIAMNQMRPPGPMIRPSRQTIPMRPNLNTARPSTPRMPSIRKPSPNISPHKPVIGKPLKISPGAMNATNTMVKRSRPEESSGPFSCFKRPKESLIPAAELSNMGGNQSVQFASTSQTSSSNFSSTTKMIKGNSVVTSTQMKSEMSASAQQIGRINNAGGVKIIKTSQFQQSQSQEKCESNSMKRNTLAAIEKLQKQGLLVKKPRLEANEDSDNSELENNDNFEYSSADEHDE